MIDVSQHASLADAIRYSQGLKYPDMGFYVPPMTVHAWQIGDCPRWDGANILIRGMGPASILWGAGYGVDIPGAVVKLRDVRVYGDPNNPPPTGVCFSRSPDGPRKGQSINHCTIQDCIIDGAFTGSAVQVLCAEHSLMLNSAINNTIGNALTYDSKDRIGGKYTDEGGFTNTCHSILHCGLAVWNKTSPLADIFPLVINGFTDSLVGQGLYITAQGCRAYICLQSFPVEHSKGNVPRWNTIDTCGWETAPGKEPNFGVLYRRHISQPTYPERLKEMPAIRWYKVSAEKSETFDDA